MTEKKTTRKKAEPKPSDKPDIAGSNDPASDALFKQPEHRDD